MKFASVLLAVCCMLSAVKAQELDKTIWLPDTLVGAGRPGCMAWSEATGLMYAGGENDAFVVGFDLAGGRRTVRIPTSGPVSALCAGPGGRLFAACAKLDSVFVIDCPTGRVTASWPAGSGPSALCLSPSGGKLYCVNEGAGSVTVFDCSTGAVLATLAVGHRPTLACASRTSDKVFVVGRGRTLASIDCQADSVLARMELENNPRAIAWNPGDNTVWACGDGWAAGVDCARDSLVAMLNIPSPSQRAVCCDSALNRIYVASYGFIYLDSTVYVIDGASRQIVRTVTVGLGPWSLLEVGNRVVVANRGSRTVSVIHAGPDTLLRRHIPAARSPWTLAADAAGERAVCLCRESNQACMYRMDSLVLSATVELASEPGSLCYNPAGNRLFATDRARYGIMMLEPGADSLLAYVSFADRPALLCCDTLDGKVYCAHGSDSTNQPGVTVLDGTSGAVLAEIPTPVDPTALLWCPGVDKVYCANGGYDDDPGFTVTCIDCASDSVRALVNMGAMPSALCYCPARNRVYCGFRSGVPWLAGSIDCRTDSLASRVTAPEDLPVTELLYVDKGNKIYCATDVPEVICVVSCDSDSLTAVIDPGAEPWSLTWAPTVNRVYCVANPPDDTRLVAIDAQADTVWRSMSLAGYASLARYALYSSASDRVYCGMSESPVGGGLLAYDCRGDSVVGFLPGLPWAPGHFVPVPGQARLYGVCLWGSALVALREPASSIDETMNEEPGILSAGPTIVRGVLFLRAGCELRVASYELLDVSGRRVLNLKLGANDVSRLAPGVYFVRAVGRELSAMSCQKVVLTR